MSFMGKGVTKAATLCLRHLVYEMATLSEGQVVIQCDLFLEMGLLPFFLDCTISCSKGCTG